MGRNHNLYGGVRIGAPMTFNDTLLDVANSDNGLPIRDVATRFRRSSTFNPSVSWRYEEAGPTDTTSPTPTSQSGTLSYWEGIYMSPDGSTLFLLDDGGTTTEVYRFSTPSAYSVASLVNADATNMGTFKGKNNANISGPKGLWFSRDGQYMFIVDVAGGSGYGGVYDDGGATGQSANTVHRFSAITPWVSYNTQADQMIGVQTSSTYVYINPTGKHIFIVAGNRHVTRYDLGTPYDLSTLTDPSITYNTSASTGGNFTTGVSFSQDGYRMVLQTNINDVNRIRYYPLSTPFDPTTIGTELHNWQTGAGGASSSSIKMMTEDGAHLYAIDPGPAHAKHWSIPSEGGTMGQV